MPKYFPARKVAVGKVKKSRATPVLCRIIEKAPPSMGTVGCDGEPVLSKNTNELKTGAPGRFDRHRLVASPSSGACRRRCRRFGVPVHAGKTPFSNEVPRSRAETWIQARAAPGPERASPIRRSSPGLDSGDDPSCGLFSDAARPCQRPAPPLWRKRGTRKSRLETKTENEASSALLARLW